MMRRRSTICSLALSIVACAIFIAFATLPRFRHAIAEPIVGRYRLLGSTHFETPIERFHKWLAPPILRDYGDVK
jgi:hypothetical protein